MLAWSQIIGAPSEALDEARNALSSFVWREQFPTISAA
jgi:hypothetical protein